MEKVYFIIVYFKLSNICRTEDLRGGAFNNNNGFHGWGL